MRLTTVILIASLMQVSAAGLAQKISLSKSNAPLKAVLKELRIQSGYDFIYTDNMLNKASSIDIHVQNQDLNEVLEKIFVNQPLTYSVDNRTVTLKVKEPSFLDRVADRVNAYLNNIDARGRILDESGKALEGATIVLKGTNRTANTNAEGEFVLANVPDDGVLVIRYVGYKQLEISLKDAVMPLEIKLNVATGELEEVKVVYNTGYQELNKERATGSFVLIDNELFNRRVGATVLERIADLVPGLLNNNIRGTTTLDNLTIRGVNTFNANKRPLFVVDNFIYEGDPNKLNPNDVESITILKDAAAASIYGARAGNGVIVITMKKGKVNSVPAISFNSNLTIGEKPDLLALPVVTSLDVIALERKRFTDGYYNSILNNRTTIPAISPIVEILARQRAGSISATEANAQIALYEQHDVRNDVNKYLLQTAVAQQYSLGISGGIDNYRYYGSVGYDRNRPNDINIQNDRLTLNFSNTWNPIKNLEIAAALNWNISKDQNNNSLGGYARVMTTPYQRIADENGNALAIPNLYRIVYADTVNFLGKLDWLYRPMDEARNGNRLNKNSGININGSLVYTVIRGVKINLAYSWQNASITNTQIQSLNTFFTRDLINQYVQKGANNIPIYPYPLGGIYDRTNSTQTAWTWRGGMNFSRTFGHHNITSIVGSDITESKTDAFAITQYGYNPETNVFGAVQPGTWAVKPTGFENVINPRIGELQGTINRFRSYYGNIGYAYCQRYTFTISGRVDESNFFGVEANDRKKPLWSAGIKWDLSKETFYRFSPVPVLSIRATYGYAGNVNAGTSPLATAVYRNPASPLFVPYAILSTPPNPELKWENVRTINLALDFGIKNQRIVGSLDFFHKLGEDLISDITAAPTTGFGTYKGNSSSMQTRGIDMSLSTRNFVGEFKWSSTFILSYQQSKVIAYTIQPPKLGLIQNGAGFFIIGKPLTAIYSYRWAGLNPLTGDARAYLGDQIVGSTEYLNKQVQSDLIYHGQTSPPMFGNFRNDFNYKNLTVSIGLSYQFGHYFRRISFAGILGRTTLLEPSWVHEDYLKAWKVPGDELATNVPGFLNSYPDQRYDLYSGADILIEKGDHIRLQDVKLNYSLNKNHIKRLPFKLISLYIYANNLGLVWTTSKYNPDTKGDIKNSITPKTFALGLSANF